MSIEHENQPISGLARILFSWFLAISLLPLVIIWTIKYYDSKQSIIDERYNELSTITSMLNRQIVDYFDEVYSTLYFHTDKANDFLVEIDRIKKENTPDVKELLRSAQYEELFEIQGEEFLGLLDFYNYFNVFIGDKDGNIVFSAYPSFGLGQNVFSSNFYQSDFSIAARKVLESKTVAYAEYKVISEEIDERLSLFVVPILDEYQNVTGFIASEFSSIDDISEILNSSTVLNDNVVTYILNSEKKIVFHPNDKSFPTSSLNSNAIDEWLSYIDEFGVYQNHTDFDIYGVHGDHGHDHGHADDHGEEAESGNSEHEEHVMIYKDWRKQNVIGSSHNLKIADTNFLLLAEVDYITAMEPIAGFRKQLISLIGITSLVVFFIAGLMTRKIVGPIQTMTIWANEVASGHFIDGEAIKDKNEIGELFRSFQVMTKKLKVASEHNQARSWYQEGIVQLNNNIRGDQNLTELCGNIITTLCRYVSAPMGAIHVMNDNAQLMTAGSFSMPEDIKDTHRFEQGEGLPGQVAKEKESIILPVPDDYFVIRSGLGEDQPNYVFLAPIVYDDKIFAVLELALMDEISDDYRTFLNDVSEIIAIAIRTTRSKETVQKLLDTTTLQAEKLEKHQNDLRVANEELEHQTNILRDSQEELQARSSELERANAELEEKSESLRHQNEEIEHKNREIEAASIAIERKAEELELASQYKSEFLANMSHELRTPLNSMIILSRMLVDNENGNLDEEEVESAQIIQKVGYDLLNLINDILDLSKVEAGQMEAYFENVLLNDFVDQIKGQFQPVAKEKGLEFNIVTEVDTQIEFETDMQRTMQILKNLLSNALKFTEQGEVSVTVTQIPASVINSTDDLYKYGAISFAVKDSGIGIPKEKQDAIFSAFQQADGSTSRKYGGTGLGLSIAREMATLLGGEMTLESEEGKGATFSLLLPAKIATASDQENNEQNNHVPDSETPAASGDKNIGHTQFWLGATGDAPILIVEDDIEFAGVVKRLADHHGSNSIIAPTGQEALTLAKYAHPQAIILDLGLPDIDGLEVLKALKDNPETKDIPVHIISGRDLDRSLLNMGVVEYLTKPVNTETLKSLFARFKQTDNNAETKTMGQVLVVDPDKTTVENIGKVLGDGRDILYADCAAKARNLIKTNNISHIIMELALPDESGDTLLADWHEELGDKMPSVIVNTAESIDRERYQKLGSLSCSMIVKDQGYSAERLQDEVALFLNSVTDPVVKRKKQAPLPSNSNEQLKGRRILLVDDDLRNTFALSKALQKYEVEIILADNGQMALEKLDEHEVDLVLMDIMMPVMDGYEATKRIREIPALASLPVIALTAKAMTGDREKCLEAGASDYLTKPIDVDKLVAMMKVWLQA